MSAPAIGAMVFVWVSGPSPVFTPLLVTANLSSGAYPGGTYYVVTGLLLPDGAMPTGRTVTVYPDRPTAAAQAVTGPGNGGALVASVQ